MIVVEIPILKKGGDAKLGASFFFTFFLPNSSLFLRLLRWWVVCGIEARVTVRVSD
jgi:hypothetical protein